MSVKLCIRFIAAYMAVAVLHGEISLVERSPFLPPGFSSKAVNAPHPVKETHGSLVLDGVFRLAGTDFANVRDTLSGKTYWLRENRERAGYVLLSFDAQANRCRIQLPDGSETVLLLQNAPKVISSPPMPVAKAIPHRADGRITVPWSEYIQKSSRVRHLFQPDSATRPED